MDENFSILKRYGENYTDKEYITNPAIGRDEQIKELILVLLTPEKSAVLVGKPGVGKTAIVEGLAYRIETHNVPNLLEGYRIINIKTASLLGTMPNGESKVQLMIDELKQEEKIILFIDEIHMLIGATTTEEYERYILRDKAFTRRFQKIEVPEPTREETIKILMGTLPKIEKTTGCKMKYTDFIKERIMTFITDITSEYKRVFEIGSRYPDIALTLLKQAFSYAMFDNTNEVNIFHIEKAIQNSKNIYPDVIKKELPRFETEFKDIITEEKTGISRIYGTSINPAPPSYTETNPKEALEKEEPVRSNNKVPQREATTEFSSNGMSEELYSLLNANAVPVHVPKEKEVDNGVIPITPSKNDDTEIILDDIDDTDNINDDFFEE